MRDCLFFGKFQIKTIPKFPREALYLCEYGTQAMAVHGGLLARLRHSGKAVPGVLAALREVEFTVERIDDVDGPLTVVAHKKIVGPSGWLYDFEVDAGACWLARGRVSVIRPQRLEAPAA